MHLEQLYKERNNKNKSSSEAIKTEPNHSHLLLFGKRK